MFGWDASKRRAGSTAPPCSLRLATVEQPPTQDETRYGYGRLLISCAMVMSRSQPESRGRTRTWLQSGMDGNGLDAIPTQPLSVHGSSCSLPCIAACIVGPPVGRFLPVLPSIPDQFSVCLVLPCLALSLASTKQCYICRAVG